VPAGKVLVLLKKNGSRSLPGDQIIVPRPPIRNRRHGIRKVEGEFGDVNGVLEEVYPERTRTSASAHSISSATLSTPIVVPNGKVGIVVKRFGEKLDEGQVWPIRPQSARPAPRVLQPARYNEFPIPSRTSKASRPNAGRSRHRGVATVMAGAQPKSRTAISSNGRRAGRSRTTEPEGFRYIKPLRQAHHPHSASRPSGSRLTAMTPSASRHPTASTSRWKVVDVVNHPGQARLLYVQYGSGGELVPYLDDKVILPYARSFSRLVGSQYSARDFIWATPKLKSSMNLSKLREACEKQGSRCCRPWSRHRPAGPISKNPINEREAPSSRFYLQQQMQVAKSAAPTRHADGDVIPEPEDRRGK